MRSLPNIYYEPVKFCAICKHTMPGTRHHILCEKCRVQCGGYAK